MRAGLGPWLLCGAIALAGGAAHAKDSKKADTGAPFAILAAPTWIAPGTPFGVDASDSFDFDGRVVSYEIRCGDFTQGPSGKSFARIPALAAGLHTIELTVTDDAGRKASVTRPIFVESALPHAQRRLEARERRAALLFMCELQDATTTEAIEDLGERTIAPLLRAAYADVTVIRGEDANPAEFFEALRALAGKRESVDVILLGHGSKDKMWFKDKQFATSSDIVRELKGKGGERVRMVYSSLCWGATLNAAWREAGAKAVAGTVDVHIPVDMVPFLVKWLRGEEYACAMGESFAANVRVHELRKDLVAEARPLIEMAQKAMGPSKGGRALHFYLDWLLKDDEWQIWRSYPQIEGTGVTIDTFAPAPVRE